MKLEERVEKMTPSYLEMFAERGGVTPTEPLEFHLFHLARYWSRLIGFCRQTPDTPEGWINGDLGACVALGTRLAGQLIDSGSPIRNEWDEYFRQSNSILYQRPVSLDGVELACVLFDQCLSALQYDPWANKPWDAT